MTTLVNAKLDCICDALQIIKHDPCQWTHVNILTKMLQVFLHGHSMVSVYKTIDMSLLPEEYLPDDYDGDCAGNLENITG